jgi:hypothetical protein
VEQIRASADLIVVPATVLINSFDRYSDCWLPVCHGFTKYWRDCPYPIFLMTNTKDFQHDRIRNLRVGGGRDWSSEVREALERIETPYVIYFQEDYWINERVDTARVTSYVALMEEHGLNYIRLIAKPAPDYDCPYDSRLGVLAEEAVYRTSIQASIWRRQVFLGLIRPGESPWEFERNGTARSRRYGETFLSAKRYGRDEHSYGMRYLCTAINKGKWTRRAKGYAKRERLPVDFSNLASDTWWNDFRRGTALGAFLVLWFRRAILILTNPKAAVEKVMHRIRQ